MLPLSEIEKQYPPGLQMYKRFMLREYLQYKILQIVYDSAMGSKLAFIGGTCLRIVHGNTRFSEDIDFDNLNIDENTFEKVADIINKELSKEGYEVEIKTVYRGAFHCYVRFPGLLYKEGLSGFTEEKILIQLDTEPQHFSFQPERFLINRFDVFTEIFTTPKDILLGQAIAYSLTRWDKLCVYTTNPRLQIDNNPVEREIRPVAMGRKAYLFAGSHDAAGRAAMIYSLFATCRMHKINPYNWLKDILQRMPNYTTKNLHELLPQNWKPTEPTV